MYLCMERGGFKAPCRKGNQQDLRNSTSASTTLLTDLTSRTVHCPATPCSGRQSRQITCFWWAALKLPSAWDHTVNIIIMDFYIQHSLTFLLFVTFVYVFKVFSSLLPSDACTLVQSAVLRLHVGRLSVCPTVRLSVTLVDQEHVG